MASSLLIDTCVLVDCLRGERRALDFLLSIKGSLRVSAMTVAELHVGVGRASEEVQVADLLAGLDVIDVDAAIARQGGRLRRRYGPSHGTGIIDALIAATAQVHGARLVTRSARHFPMLDDVLVPYP